MAVEEALRKVERDVAAGDLGLARDRLHGLIAARPDDLELRRRLARVYRDLQLPSMAGRYWYLEEERTPEWEGAVRAFERACGGSPVLILQALKFKGDLGPIEGTYAGRTLLALQREARCKYGYVYRFGRAGREAGAAPLRESLADKLFPVGCAVLCVVGAGLTLTGLVTVIRWFSE